MHRTSGKAAMADTMERCAPFPAFRAKEDAIVVVLYLYSTCTVLYIGGFCWLFVVVWLCCICVRSLDIECCAQLLAFLAFCSCMESHFSLSTV